MNQFDKENGKFAIDQKSLFTHVYIVSIRKLIFLFAGFALPLFTFAQIRSGEVFVKINRERIGSIDEFVWRDSILQLKKHFEIKTFERTFGLNDERLLPYFHLVFSSEEEKHRFLNKSAKYSWIEFAEEVPEYNLFHLPNDIQQKQWHLPKINAEMAWDFSRGASLVNIAIVDDAVLTTHEDLASVVWINSGEIPGNNIDDDGNGYVDDIYGWDAADNDNNPNPPSVGISTTNFSHGTHCAGIAGARTNNGIGIASISYNCRIIPVKTKRSNTSGGSLQAAMQGVEYAIAVRAHVINMSFGSDRRSQTMQDLINVGASYGLVFVAAAGNMNTVAPMFPANYNHVISVGATDAQDIKASFSNFGAGTDIMAPGVDIWSTVATSTTSYDYLSGTSMASPLVAGLAALMIARDSTLTPLEIENCIKSAAYNIYPVNNPNFSGNLGAGRIDAYATLTCVKGVLANMESDITYVCPGGQVQFYDKSTKGPTSWLWKFAGGIPSTSNLKNPLITYPNPGTYEVQLKVENAVGMDSIVRSGFITVGLPSVMMGQTYSIPVGYSVNLKMDFVGSPPWKAKLVNGQFSVWIDSIMSTPYYFAVTPMDTTVYRVDSLYDKNCQGISKDSSRVNVYGNFPCLEKTQTYSKSFQIQGIQKAHSLEKCIDGGFIWVGVTTGVGAGNEDLYVVRMNDTGRTIWARVIGGPQQDFGYSAKVIQTADSGFAIVGVTKGFAVSGTEDGLFLKFDKAGNLQIQKKIYGDNVDELRGIRQTADNKYVIVGTTGSLPRSGWNDAYLLLLDSTGNILWTRKMGFPGGTTNHALDVDVLPGGNILILGSGSHGLPTYDGYLAKYTPTGNVLLEKRIATSDDDFIVSMARLRDGTYAVASSAGTYSLANMRYSIFNIDSNGTILWHNKLGTLTGDARATCITATKDSGFVVSGHMNSFGNGNDIVNVKYSKGGVILWSKRYGGSQNEVHDSWNHGIIEMPDGSLVFGVTTTSFSSSNEDLLLLRTDPCGNGCLAQDVSFTLSSPSATSQNITSNKNVGGMGQNILPGNFNWTDTLNKYVGNVCPQAVVSVPACRVEADFSVEEACAGMPTVLTDKSKDNTSGRSIVYKRWIIGADTFTGLSLLKYTFQTPGVRQIKLIAGNNEQPACYDTMVKHVNIENVFKIQMNLPDTICSGDSVNVTLDKEVCYSGKVLYQWSPAVSFDNPARRTPVFSLASSSWIYLTAWDSLGNISKDSQFVVVNGNCCKSYAKWKVDGGVCLGDSLEIQNISISKSGAINSWEIIPAAQFSAYTGNMLPKLKFTSYGTYSVKLTVQDICGTSEYLDEVYVMPKPQVNLVNDTVLCEPTSLYLNPLVLAAYDYEWSPANSFSDRTLANQHTYIAVTSKFYLKVTDTWTGCQVTDSVLVSIEQLDTLKQNIDTALCTEQRLDISYPSHVSVTWSDGVSANTRSLNPPGLYTAELRANGCYAIDSIDLEAKIANVKILGDDLLCLDSVGTYSVSGSLGSLRWSTGDTTRNIHYAGPSGIIWVEVQSEGCESRDSLFVERFDSVPDIIADDFFCLGDSLEIRVHQSANNLRWSTGATTNSITIWNQGWYWVENEKNGCVLYDSIWIKEEKIPVVNLGEDTVICQGDVLTYSFVRVPGSSIQWNTGDTTHSILIQNAGEYWVMEGNRCGFSSDTINVALYDCNCIVYIPSSFTPNNDDLNDGFGSVNCEVFNYELIIFDKWGKILYRTEDRDKPWEGDFNGTPLPEGVYIYLIKYSELGGARINKSGNVTLLRPKKP